MKKFESSPFLWGIAVTLVVLPIVSFASGFVVTRGWADEKADQRAAKAVVESLAVICVAQVTRGADRMKHLAGLKAASYSDKGDFVATKGWATMPGAEKPHEGVARACAERLLTASN
jgi:hypothetical protein